MKKITFLILGLAGAVFLVGTMARAETVLAPSATKVVMPVAVVAEVELIQVVPAPEPSEPSAPTYVGGGSGYVRPAGEPISIPYEPPSVEELFVYTYVEGKLEDGEVARRDGFAD